MEDVLQIMFSLEEMYSLLQVTEAGMTESTFTFKSHFFRKFCGNIERKGKNESMLPKLNPNERKYKESSDKEMDIWIKVNIAISYLLKQCWKTGIITLGTDTRYCENLNPLTCM